MRKITVERNLTARQPGPRSMRARGWTKLSSIGGIIVTSTTIRYARGRSVPTADAPTWETSLLRALQSWRDSAGAASARDEYGEECVACEQDPYLAQIVTDSPWPHWMRHELRDRLHALRSDEFFRALDRPFDETTTLGDHYREQSADQTGENAPGSRPEAVLVVEDHMATWDLWIFARLAELGDWERLMFRDIDRRRQRAERRKLAKFAHPSALGAPHAAPVTLPPLDPEALTTIVDQWIEDLDEWNGHTADVFGESCELCSDFFMVEAAGLPRWTPHALRHDLARCVANLMAEHYPYDWRTGLEPSAELLGVPESDVNEVVEATERCRVEFEDRLFREMRTHAARLVDALESSVLPRLNG